MKSFSSYHLENDWMNDVNTLYRNVITQFVHDTTDMNRDPILIPCTSYQKHNGEIVIMIMIPITLVSPDRRFVSIWY